MADWLKESFSFHDLQRIMSKLIDGTDVFARMTQADVMQLLERAEKCTFTGGETILREGATGDFLYVLLDGEVSVRKGSGQQMKELAHLRPGSSFGEMSLVDHEVRSASVVALGKCLLLRIGEADCWRQPTVAAKLFRNIAHIVTQRLREMDEAYLWGHRDLADAARRRQ
jgi:CRP-like cAMP-binding protein